MSRQAMTLPEVLVASTLLLLMVTLGSSSLVAYLRATRDLEPRMRQIRLQAHALETLTHRLHSGAVWLAPEEMEKMGYRPVLGANAPALVRVHMQDGPRALGLTFDPGPRQVVMLEYATDDPHRGSPRVVPLGPTGQTGLWLSRERTRSQDFITIRLEGPSGQLPRQTTVCLAP